MSRGGESPCWGTVSTRMMEEGAKGEKWEVLRKLWKKWAKVEVAGEGAGGQPAKNQLKETELGNRHSFGGDAHCSTGNTDHSCWKHTITAQPEAFQQEGSVENLAPECPGQQQCWHSHHINQLQDCSRGSLNSLQDKSKAPIYVIPCWELQLLSSLGRQEKEWLQCSVRSVGETLRLWLQNKETNPLCSDIPHSGNCSLATALVSACSLS